MKFADLPKIVFQQSWQGVEWAAKQIFAGTELSDQVGYIRKPEPEIYDSLTKMHDVFYPNEAYKSVEDATKYVRKFVCDGSDPRDDLFLPWVLHKALFDARKKNRAGNIRIKDAKGIIRSRKYDEIIKTILEREWLLSWHWRAGLSSLREYNPDDTDNKLVIQISHVRKWEMLLCYLVSNDDLAEHDISEIPLEKKNLRRAPLFGLSHRLKGWDTYRLFYHPDIKKYIHDETKEVKNLQTNKTLAEAYILGRHDCYYIVETKLEMDGTAYKWILKTFVNAQPEKVLIDKDILGDKAFYYRPTDLVDIPSFTVGHEGIPQLLSSDNYCEAILELTEVLNDPTAKSVLLIAPPGSGKEKLAESAFYCRDQTKPSGDFVGTTLAGLNAVEAAKLLFSVDDRLLKTADPKKLLEDYEPAKQSRDGLILKALGGALFIDEIDKTDRSIRDLLLRVLESREITVPGTSQILKIPKDKIPLYIFAGSMNRTSMFQESPPDFWTRISHVIEVAHPLGINDIEKARKVVKDYLWMFWCIHVKDFMKKKGAQHPDTAHEIMKPLNDFYISLYTFLLDRKTVDFATEILADEVSGRGKPLVSIRTLRSIVARSVFKFVDVLLYSKFDQDPIEIFKDIKRRGGFSYDTTCEWFDLLLEIIANENKRKFSDSTTTTKTIDRVEFSVVESFRSAIRLGASLAQ
jgi:hypothetical protein